MELNITKQNVSVNELAFNQSVEHGVDFDVILPDYCGAIEKILKVDIVPHVTSKSLSGQSLTTEGSVFFRIVYLDEDGLLSSYEYVEPFTKSVDVGREFDCCYTGIRIKCGYNNTRAVASRKLEVHCTVLMQIKIFCRKQTEVIADIDCEGVYVDRGTAPATTPINTVEKNMIIEEELELGSAQPSAVNIIRYDASAVITDHKIVNDRVIVKGDLHVFVLYCPEDRSAPQKYDAVVPFSQIIDVDGINEDCECNAGVDVSSVELKLRSAYDGDIRSFMLCAKLCITAAAVCNNDIPVIYDAFSSKYGTAVQSREAVFEKSVRNISERFVCKKNLDFSDGAVNDVIDLWCSGEMQGCRIDGGVLIITGSVTVCVLAYDEKKVINYNERTVEYEYRCDNGELPPDIRCEPSVEIVSSNYTLSGGNSMEARIELLINAVIYEIKRVNLVTEIETGEKEPNNCANDCSMVIYYADIGERVWNIAKHYSASPDEIMQINSVDEIVTDAKPLIIPR